MRTNTTIHMGGVRLAATALAVLLTLGLGCGGDGDGGDDGGDPDVVQDVPDLEDLGQPDGLLDGEDTPDGGDGSDVDVVASSGAWSQESLGDEGVLEAVFAVSSQEAYAVGGTRVLRYDGSQWSVYGEPTDGALHGVWASEEGVLVVGDGGLVAHRSPGSLGWTVEDPGVHVDLYGVAGDDLDDLWVVGDESTILHRGDADAGWEISQEGGGVGLRAVWSPPGGAGADGVLAVGTGGTLYRRTEEAWVTQQIGSAATTLHAVLGVGQRRFAVGSGGAIAVKDDELAPWKGHSSNLEKVEDLHALAGSDPDHVVAFGTAGAVLLYDGDKWSVQTVTGPYHAASDLVGATHGPAAGEMPAHWMAISATGGGIVLTDEAWIDMETRPKRGLTHIAGSSRDGLWATGRSGLLLAMTAHGWTSVPTGVDAHLLALAVTADGTVWAVGEAGTVLRRPADGPLEFVAVPVPGDLLSIVVSEEEVLIGGKGGTILRGPLDGSLLSFWFVGMSGDVRAVARTDDGAIWIAGGFGSLLRSTDGETAVAIPTGVGWNLNALAPWADGVMAAGDNGLVLHVGAEGDVVQVYDDPGLYLYGVSTHGESAWAVGWHGTTLRRVDEQYVDEPSGTQAVLETVWQDDEGALAAGRFGGLLTWMEGP